MYSPYMLTACFCFALQLLTFAEADKKSSGCGKPLARNLTQGGTGESNALQLTTSDGTLRTYLLHIPEKYDTNTATPLILSFHGRTRTGEYQESLTGFSEKDWNPDSFAVYPDGLNQSWQGDPDSKTDDVSFVLDLLHELEQDYCIDESRIYSSGMSNGGGFSVNILACNDKTSSKFAALAGHSAAIYQEGTNEYPTCNTSRSDVPILEIHGSDDDVIPFHGGPRRGYYLPNILDWITQWAKKDNLDNSPDKSSSHSDAVVTREFGQQKTEGLVTQVWVQGLGHIWASTDTGAPTNASLIMLDYFKNYTLPSELLPSDESSPTSSSSASSSPTTSSGPKSSTSIATPGCLSPIALVLFAGCFCILF